MLTAKKLLFSTLALGAMLTSCSSDENLIEGNGTDLVTFSVNVPDMLESRAGFGENSSSAMGGITNVDMTRYDLRYQLAVFSEDGEMVVAPKMKVVDSYQPVTYDFRLTPNRNYQVVVWAAPPPCTIPPPTSRTSHASTTWPPRSTTRAATPTSSPRRSPPPPRMPTSRSPSSVPSLSSAS